MTPGPGRHVALFINSLKGGGAERSTANLAIALSERGVPVDLVLARADGIFLKDVPSEVRVIDLAVNSALGALPSLVRNWGDFRTLAPMILGPRPPRTLGAVPKLARYLVDARPAALLSALDYGNVTAVLAGELANVGTRVVVSQRNHFTSDRVNARKRRVKRAAPVIRRFYPRADAIVAVSNGVADDIAQACWLPRARVHTIYNAVAGPELDAQAAAPLDHPWFAADRPPVILGVGKLKPQKDFPNLIRAFAILRRTRPARLLILGEGPDRRALEALVKSEGLANEVALPGFADNPFAFMARADLFVLSSAFEGLPGVLIQALACGCPVVATDCPSGPNEILEGGRHGLMVPVGDPDALAEAMKARLDAPSDRDALKRRAAFFSRERAAEAYLDVLLGPLAATTLET